MKGLLKAIAIASLAVLTAVTSADVRLRLSVWDGDEALKIIRDKIVPEFERQNPGIKVKLENYPDYNLYHQKMLITYAAGIAPDVVMMDGNFQRLAKRGALLPLNPLWEKTPGFDINDYYKEIVDSHSYKGTCYVLPRDIAPVGIIYYNKKAFDEAGIPYPDGSWTWDFQERPELKEKDFLWVCRQLTKKTKEGKVTRWAYSNGWPEIWANQVAFTTGAYPVDDPEDPTKVLIDDPNYIRGYQFASDLMNKLKYQPSTSELTTSLMATGQQLFVQQRAAMYQNGIWEVPNMRKMLKPGAPDFFEWDICLAPSYGPASKDGKRVSQTVTGGSGYGIMASTKHPEEAWKLTQFMAGEYAMTQMAKAGIAQPAIKELATKPGVWCPGPDTPLEERYPANRIATHEAVPHVRFAPTSELYPEINNLAIKGLELVWQGKKTAKEVLTENKKLAQDRLDTLREEQQLAPFNWSLGALVALLIIATILFWVYKPEFGRKLTRMEAGDNRAGYRFILPWIIGAVVFATGPMILSLLMAFADWDAIRPAKFRGVQNFVEAGTRDPFFWKSLQVTFTYTFWAVPLGIIGSMLLAMLLNQKVKGVAVFRAIYYVPSIASAVAGALIWRRIFSKDTGLLNNLLYGPDENWPVGRWLTLLFEKPGNMVDWLNNEQTALPALIIMSLWGLGSGTVVFLAGLQGIPQFYYEAATLDGANNWKKFRNITWPMLTPTIFFTAVTGFIGTFQSFTQAFIMTQGGPNGSTMFYALHLYNNAFANVRMGYASALGWVLFVIILIFTAIQFAMQRFVYYEGDSR